LEAGIPLDAIREQPAETASINEGTFGGEPNPTATALGNSDSADSDLAKMPSMESVVIDWPAMEMPYVESSAVEKTVLGPPVEEFAGMEPTAAETPTAPENEAVESAANRHDAGHPPTESPGGTEWDAVKASATESFRPSWRVDQFLWPRVCRRLMVRASDELDRLADAVTDAVNEGRRVLAVASRLRGEGTTTLLLCVARRLAERGMKLILVDADLARPRLASRLGVEAPSGWNEIPAITAETLAQTIVESASGGPALLPARDGARSPSAVSNGARAPSAVKNPAQPGAAVLHDATRMAQCLSILRRHYDAVLMDLGPLENADASGESPAWAAAGAIDAIIFARNGQLTSDEELFEMERRTTATGIAAVGLVENFAVQELQHV